MAYMNASINPSATIIAEPAQLIQNAAHTFVKFDANGKFVRAAAGDAAMGVVIGLVEDADEQYSVQVKDIGLVRAAAAVKAGDALAVGADGKAAKATTGQFIMGYCIRGGAAEALVEIQLTKSGKEA